MTVRNNDTTEVIPAAGVIAPDGDMIFQRITGEKMTGKKTLADVGLTKITLVYADEEGIVRPIVRIVSWDTLKMILATLDRESIA